MCDVCVCVCVTHRIPILLYVDVLSCYKICVSGSAKDVANEQHLIRHRRRRQTLRTFDSNVYRILYDAD